MTKPILITGATGTVGRHVVELARAVGLSVRTASRRPAGQDSVAFNFTVRHTWADAVNDVDVVFLVRPPEVSNVGANFLPFCAYAREQGVKHVVLLSVQGAGKVPVLPHARIEHWLQTSGISWTFVRPSYFSQNLSGVFAADIRDRDEIVVPAGRGRTAFVDARDVAAVVVRILQRPQDHRGVAWTPTGPALRYAQVAEILSHELGRRIRYRKPDIIRYARHARSHLAMPPGMIALTTVLHTTARLGLAGFETDDVHSVTGHDPTTFAEFARRERSTWLSR